MKKSRIFSIVAAVLLLAAILYCRHVAKGDVIGYASRPGSAEFIQVVKFPQTLNFESLIGMGEPAYRCEYYQHPNMPATATTTVWGESLFIDKLEVEWGSTQAATGSAMVKYQGGYFKKWSDGHWD